MNVSLNLEQYLKDLEYLVNIDSQSKTLKECENRCLLRESLC